MRYVFCCLTFLFLSFGLFARPTEQDRIRYSEGIQKAFELQFAGKTRMAFYAFRDVYQTALKNGECPAKLAAIEELFVWYRKYGFDTGLLKEPANCQGEWRSDASMNNHSVFTPRQEKIMRDFLYGVGCMVSGIFCVTVNTPISGKFGASLVLSGGKCMYDAISAMIEDHELRFERIASLDKISRNAIAILDGEK